MFRRQQRADVISGQPGVRTEEFHVQRMVLATGEHTAGLGIPAVGIIRTPGVGDGLAQRRPPAEQSFGITVKFPVAEETHDLAELAIRTRAMKRVIRMCSQRQYESEMAAAELVHTVFKMGIPHAAFQIREQKCQCLRISQTWVQEPWQLPE